MEPIEKVRLSKEYKQRKEQGVDVEALLAAAQELDRYKKYKSPATRESILMSAIIPNREDEGEPFDEELLVLGGGDRYGGTFPVNFIALRKNKKFCFISDFDANKYPVPCKCRVVGKFTDNQYGFTVKSTNGTVSDIEPRSFEDVQKVIQKFQIVHKDWDKLENLCSNGSEIRVFRGNIAGLKLSGIFKDKVKIGDNAVLSLNERAPPTLHPTMQIGLESTGGYFVSANLDRQRHGQPLVNIEDFEALCIDAVEQFPDNKDSQLEFVRSGIVGREVLLVMNVYQNKPGKNEKRYITGSCPFIMEALDNVSSTDARETLQTETPSPSPSHEAHAENPFVEALVSSCLTLNQDPAYVPVTKAREIASIGAEVSDNMVQEMTKRASQVWKERKV